MRLRSNHSIDLLVASLLTLVGIDARVDRARHQRHAARLRRVAAGRHHRGGDERLDAGLAHGDDVRAGAELLEEADQVVDVVVEAELALREADVARVVPVGDVDVVVGQQRSHRVAQQRGEVPGERRHDQHAGLARGDILLEIQHRAEGQRERRDLADRDLAVADHDGMDAVGGALVRQARRAR